MAEVEHVVSITAHFERERDDYLLKPPTTYAIVELKPPIDPGDDFTFKRAVLGREWCLVDMHKLFATAEAIVFLAESSISNQDHRHEDIAVIARRLGELANNPRAALRMMEDKPFPEHPKPEPRLEMPKGPSVEKDKLTAEVPPINRIGAADASSDDERSSGFLVHLAPVEVPLPETNTPSAPKLDEKNLKPPEDPPPVDTPRFSIEEVGGQSSVFGPVAARLTSFAPQAHVLPWPPPRGEGRHALRDQADN